jgi:hypothetical protein
MRGQLLLIFGVVLFSSTTSDKNVVKNEAQEKAAIINATYVAQMKSEATMAPNAEATEEPVTPQMLKTNVPTKEATLEPETTHIIQKIVLNKEVSQEPEKIRVFDDFDPYRDDDPDMVMGMGANGKLPPAVVNHDMYNDELSHFDFDPSEGLTFYMGPNSVSCFIEDVKSMDDDLLGAYIVSSASSSMHVQIKDSVGNIVHEAISDAEGSYDVTPQQIGVHEICFHNDDGNEKLVSYVTNMLESQHPVEKGTTPSIFNEYYISSDDYR